MSAILYYITGHGYGHAVRSHQVIRALAGIRPNLPIHVRTTAPKWLFHNTPTAIHYYHKAIDAGIVQSDSLLMDLRATLAACRAIAADSEAIIDSEQAFIRCHDISVIVGDTPPLCFEIAARAEIPSVSITNFTWDVIYRAYVDAWPEFEPLAARMTEYYRRATLALTLPYPCDTSMFVCKQAIPWITRKSLRTKAQARRLFALPANALIVLLSFGGLGLERLPLAKLRGQSEFLFVTTGAGRERNGNLLTLPSTQSQYEDLVRAADAIVTKPGYGVVADVLAQRLPILYTDRGDFAEYPRLVEALHECATAAFIPQEELLAGQLEAHLQRLLSQPANWPGVELNGAQVAAQRILSLLDDN